MSKKVALMCGHGKSVDGSWDPGCAYGGYTEAGLMLPITKAAVKYLRSYGITVISDADTNNNKNMIADVRWANQQKCDIYVSVHCDYSKAPSGVMPLYVSSGGKKLATALNNSIKSAMGMRSRGVIRRTDLWELNGTDMVACILETGAIKADLSILKKKPDTYGKAIAKGICDYFGVKPSESVIKPIPAPAPKQTNLYRVRKSWKDVKSQVGAFSDLNNAKELADQKHLNVYDKDGKLVYKGKVAPSPSPKPAVKANELIFAKAEEYAYKTNSSKAKYPNGKPTEAYKKALASLPASMHKWCKAAILGANCDVYAWVCVRKAGTDPNFPSGLWKQLAYMEKHYTKVEPSEAEPGDIGFYRKDTKKKHGHIFIIGKNGQVKEASHNQYYPKTTNSLKTRLSTKGKKYVYVFRPKVVAE